MSLKMEWSLHLLDHAYRTLRNNLRHLTLEEALFVPQGGYRSILGTLKHAAAWSHVYRSYAFDAMPVQWAKLNWPRGLRDTIHKSNEYLQEVIQWFVQAHTDWTRDLGSVTEIQLDESRRLHWGETAPLYQIVVLVAGHHLYHAGELNQTLSICRGEAWEEGEEVEENNISTASHRVRPDWMED